jgi:hypothetical protein
MASWPLVRKARSDGSRMTRRLTGSSRCSRDPLPGGDQRVPRARACVGQVDRGDPVGHLPGAAEIVALDPGGALTLLDLAGLSIAATARPRRPPGRAAWSSPATANRRTAFIAAAASQTARLSSRCIRSGARSPARSASVQPLRRGRSLISAAAYLPACSHGPTRAKHGRSSSSSSACFRRPSPAPILTAAAASGFVVFTNAESPGGCATRRPYSMLSSRSDPNAYCRTRARA